MQNYADSTLILFKKHCHAREKLQRNVWAENCETLYLRTLIEIYLFVVFDFECSTEIGVMLDSFFIYFIFIVLKVVI